MIAITTNNSMSVNPRLELDILRIEMTNSFRFKSRLL